MGALAAALVPALTSVAIPRRQIGEAAARMILDRVDGGELADGPIDVGFELIVRASS